MKWCATETFGSAVGRLADRPLVVSAQRAGYARWVKADKVAATVDSGIVALPALPSRRHGE
jgi:hypothetical protein